jgi:hypothetical protein
MAELKNTIIEDTAAIQLPVGTTAERPQNPTSGYLRYNRTLNTLETYDNQTWKYVPDVVRDGLVLYLDAAEPNSAPDVSLLTNLITNGDFDENVNGWTTFNSSNTWSSGRMQISRSGGTGLASYQVINTTPGVRYSVSAEVNSSGSRGDLYVNDGSGWGGLQLLLVSGTAGQTLILTGTFTAFSSTTTVAFAVDTNLTSIFVDKVSVFPLTTWRDLSGNGYNGSLAHGATYNSSSGGNIVFDGYDDVINGTINGSLFTGNFTQTAWIYKLNATQAWQGVFTNSSPATNNTYLMTFGNGSAEAPLNSVGLNQVGVLANGVFLNLGVHTNRWLYIVITKSGTTLSIYCYKDGQLLQTFGTLTWNSGNFATTNNYQIGRHWAGGSGTGVVPLQGNVSQVKIYNKALTPREIQQNYDATKYRFETPQALISDGLILYLDAAQTQSYSGSGTTWTDLSGRNQNATLVNGVSYTSSNSGNLIFDGSNDYASLTSNDFTNSLPNFTVSVWFYKTVDGILLGNHFHNSTWESLWFSTTQFTVNGANDSVTNRQILPFTTPNNTWNNLVAVNNSSQGYMKVFLNGVEIATKNATVVPWNSGIIPTIGAQRRTDGAIIEPIRGNIAQVLVYNRYLTVSEIQQNYNVTKNRFLLDSSKDGSTPERAAPSASYLLSLGIVTDGVYYIDLPTVGPTPVYCILNPAYDGGGWMMAMKATTGTTFNYSANYWTTANTLNPSETNKNNGDAKFDSMNYFPARDIMAVWPDISNIGTNSGSIDNLSNWTWLENNFNNGTRQTLISFFTSPSNRTYTAPSFGGAGYFIQDAKTFSGWASGVFSSQTDIRFYGFNYDNYPNYFGGSVAKVRWGFGWNENAEGLFPSVNVGAVTGSNDVGGGIGMDTQFGSYSAGDRINCCQDTTGINRSARVEVYIR